MLLFAVVTALVFTATFATILLVHQTLMIGCLAYGVLAALVPLDAVSVPR